MTERLTIAALPDLIGKEIGVSDWREISQDRISNFAEVTEDFQYIHVDSERAAKTPFGGTIAHGFLGLSLLSAMFEEAVGEIDGVAMSMNYGFDSVRFLVPVKTGARIRARFSVKEASQRKAGQWRLVLDTKVEIDGEEKPALIAEWVILLFAEA